MTLGCRLKITQSGTLCGPTTRVWLNDVEITHDCQRVTLDALVGDVTQATITVLVNELDIDVATATLIAGRLLPGAAVRIAEEGVPS